MGREVAGEIEEEDDVPLGVPRLRLRQLPELGELTADVEDAALKLESSLMSLSTSALPISCTFRRPKAGSRCVVSAES